MPKLEHRDFNSQRNSGSKHENSKDEQNPEDPKKIEYLIKREDIYEQNKTNKKPLFKSRFHSQIREDQKQQKNDTERNKERAADLASKKLIYGQFVKE